MHDPQTEVVAVGLERALRVLDGDGDVIEPAQRRHLRPSSGAVVGASSASFSRTTSLAASRRSAWRASVRYPPARLGRARERSANCRARISVLTFTFETPARTARWTSVSGSPEAPCSASG